MANYLILSCDGGGIRGYLSSLLLQRLNDDLGIFGSNNQNIDLYAGTSTGGLIALALAQGKSIDSIVDLYATAGKDIFCPASFQPGCLLGEAAGAAAGLADVKGLWQVLYDDIGDPSVQSVIESFIPGNPLLSSLASNVMVTTFQLSDSATPPSWNPLVIDNFAGSPGSSTYLWDAALSTSAAPVYFPPYNHPQFGWCSDGGAVCE
jgi:patatin-like phospholipase/acyl hydrolase